MVVVSLWEDLELSLRLDEVAFGYPGHTVGAAASFELHSGEVLCFLGPNGCGKTTLFKTILGLIDLQAGAVYLDDRSTSSCSQMHLARAIAYVPQQHDAYFPFTVLEVVMMGRSPHLGLFKSPTRHDEAIADAMLNQLNIGHLREEIYTRVSGGERQLTLIARALAQEPRILIMDEPTTNLDFGNQIKVLAQIKNLARQGISIIISTHDPDHAFQCADRVAMLKGGSIIAVGKPAEILTDDALQVLYDVRVKVMEVRIPHLPKLRRICIPLS